MTSLFVPGLCSLKVMTAARCLACVSFSRFLSLFLVLYVTVQLITFSRLCYQITSGWH